MNAETRDPGRIHEDRLLEHLRALWVVVRTAVDECEETGDRILPHTADDPAPSPEAVAFIRTTVLEHAKAAARAADMVWGAGVASDERDLSRILHVVALASATVAGIAAGSFDDGLHPLFISVEEMLGAAYRDLLDRLPGGEEVDHAA